MKDRLVQLLDMEQLTPSKFADIIGVQRSSVSHVISGRNKPSFDFIQKTLKAFPGLHADWLILGDGAMYEQMGRSAPVNLFSPPNEAVYSEIPDDISSPVPESDRNLNSDPPQIESDVSTNDIETFENQADDISKEPVSSKEEKRVVQVMIFYDDDTFKSYDPSL